MPPSSTTWQHQALPKQKPDEPFLMLPKKLRTQICYNFKSDYGCLLLLLTQFRSSSAIWVTHTLLFLQPKPPPSSATLLKRTLPLSKPSQSHLGYEKLQNTEESGHKTSQQHITHAAWSRRIQTRAIHIQKVKTNKLSSDL